MKIAINGNLIDTEHIYMITPIMGDSLWGDEKERTEKWRIHHSSFSFKVLLFNDQRLSFRDAPTEEEFGIPQGDKSWWDTDFTTYEQRLDISKKRLEAFREQLVRVWTDNKPKIPQFNQINVDEYN